MGQFEKPWKDLTFADNFIFCKVMGNERLCRRMIEILLGIRVERIEYLGTEETMDSFYKSRAVRFDVYARDSGGRVFDVELQTGAYSDILLRSRYYLGASDVALARRRSRFRDIRETYIIFICKDDPFGAGLPVYTKHTCFAETDAVPYDDKSHAVFYNCSAYRHAEDADLRSVLRFIYESRAESDYTHELEDAVSDARALSGWEDEYMYFTDIIEEERETAHEAGRAQGKRETAINLLKNGVDAEIVAKSVGFSMEQVLALRESCGN